MKRSTPLRSRGFAAPRREAKVIEYTPRPRVAPLVVAMSAVTKPAPPSLQKVPCRVQTSIRESARGEDCLVRIPGVCRGHPDYTIWSHAPLGSAGKGKSIKALDLCGAYCCTACDAVIDGQAPLPAGYTRDMAMNDWFFGHMRSLVRLRQKGLV